MEKAKKLWDNYKVIGEAQKNERLKLVVGAGTRDGYRCISIREFYYKKSTDEWKPGKDGITFSLKAPINKGESFVHTWDELKLILEEAAKHAATMDLLDEDNAIYWGSNK